MKQCPKCGFLVNNKTQICPGRYPNIPCGYDFTNEDNENLKNLCIKDQEIQKKQPLSKPIYFYISIPRLIFMCIISFGLYEIYWIYKNWKFIKKRDEQDISPFWRGIFGIFFYYSLLKRIKNDKEAIDILKADFIPGANAGGWILFNILGNLFYTIFDYSMNPIDFMIGYIFVQFSFIFIIPIQGYINIVNRSLVPKPKYSPWSLGQFICLFIGTLIWFGIIKTIFFL